ncbi:hypothetical protein [Macrococcus armenti]|uniref:hypothetical protein n=1 Tax=Macrococcus armenti TaxID=2875764 RepID=UPI001CC998BE|nr:hypothetical protein [Macrococcus armenti]UBH08308.1 hypothetical protein LAU41_10010 [Macrococcus armenti]UBH10539.1 hypothetical protein LAU38_09930 [Macrococcus armenti]
MIFFNSYHPNAVYIDYRENTFSAYFKTIKEQFPDKIYIVRVDSGKPYEELLKEGFTECRKTYDIVLDKKCLFNSSEQGNNDSFILSEALVFKWYQIYRETHQINPVREYEPQIFENLLKRDLDTNHSIVLFNKYREITAYALIYFNNETYEIGYVYFKNYKYKKRLEELLNNKIRNIFDLGKEYISIEVDDTDKYAYELFNDYIKTQTQFAKNIYL